MAQPSLFHPIEPSRLSDEAVRQIKALIVRAVFKPGELLPSKRQLFGELSVSRASVREALRVLEAMGYIEVQPGVGAYVVDRHIGRGFSSKWMEWMVDHHQEVDELLELREALEPKAASLAAQYVTEESLAAIKAALARMEQCAEMGNIDGAVEADVEFHDLINHAARNEVLVKLNESINHVLLESRYAYFQDPSRLAGSCRQHGRVVAALEKRDPPAAAAAMLAHVQYSRRYMRQLVQTSDEIDD